MRTSIPNAPQFSSSLVHDADEFVRRDAVHSRHEHGNSSTMEEESEVFNIHIARYRPEELHKLCSKTKFTRKEIQLMYRGFKQECPTGLVDEDGFKHIFSQFFPQGDATNYAHYVFNTMKQKNSAKINFEDFLNILSKVSRGSVEEKLQWVFGLYDLDGDGLISKSEMVDVVTSIYEMLGRQTRPLVEVGSAKEHVEKIFHFPQDFSRSKLMDANKDGVVSIDELVNWVSRDERVLGSLETLDTIKAFTNLCNLLGKLFTNGIDCEIAENKELLRIAIYNRFVYDPPLQKRVVPEGCGLNSC